MGLAANGYGRYDWFGWWVEPVGGDVSAERLVETHEYFHRQLDDTTAFGGLTSTVAALAASASEPRWLQLRDDLQEMSDLVHESFAVAASLLTSQRALHKVAGYPTYERHLRTARRLVGQELHPWVALSAIRAAASASMQSRALALATREGIATFAGGTLPRLERPNHRLDLLLKGGYASRVEHAAERAEQEHGHESWWQHDGEVRFRPESMDGAAAEAATRLYQQLFAEASSILASGRAATLALDAHQQDLRELLGQARSLAPEGFAQIGALVEAPGGELLHGGPLDGQTITLTIAPDRAVLLPFGSASGLSGEDESLHAFVVVTRPTRIRAAYGQVDGIALPQGTSIACLRSSVFDGPTVESVVLIPVEIPQIDEAVPVFVSVFSSAAAFDPAGTAKWLSWAGPHRASLVMDTPATAALRRWCGDGAVFRCETRAIRVADRELRIIAGRVERGERRSPLVVIATSEFGSRWFEAACAEDPALAAAVQVDESFFDAEGWQLDVVINHLLLEERFIGTGSWRR